MSRTDLPTPMSSTFGDRRTGVVSWPELQLAAARANSHFFDPPSMRFFKSRLCSTPRFTTDPDTDAVVIAFITSERDFHGERRYSIRRFDGQHVTTLALREFATLAAARRAMDVRYPIA